MTREEAIKILQEEIDGNLELTLREWQERDEQRLFPALRMAIEALSADTNSDLISRANAIRWVKTECNPYGKPTLDYDSGLKVIEHLKKMPSELPSAGAEWIPCSERLPKKGEVVLITNGKGNVRCGQYRSEYDVRGETHYWWWKGKTIESVLAWMPLPKPYREDGDV